MQLFGIESRSGISLVTVTKKQYTCALPAIGVMTVFMRLFSSVKGEGSQLLHCWYWPIDLEQGRTTSKRLRLQYLDYPKSLLM